MIALLARPAFALLIVVTLIAAVAGGLLRLGISLFGAGEHGYAAQTIITQTLLTQAALAHGALMLSGFLGTVIAIERAVALRQRWAFAAPLASGLATVLMLAGRADAGAWCGVLASLVFVAVNVVVVKRQTAAHTVLLLVGACAWLAGSLLFALDGGQAIAPSLAWWFLFPVLTIAAERLEMTRMMQANAVAQPALFAIVLALLASAAWSQVAPMQGGVTFGVALTALGIWLGLFDIARRTVFAQGLSRYMALCLLGGYVWLGLAGVAWAGTAVGCPGRDMALHALGLGFIVSMVMGHAPVILPAVARIKLQFGGWFYLPLLLLHASLALRLGTGFSRPGLQALGAELNALALALFAATVAGSAVAWRLNQRVSVSRSGD